MIFKELTNRLLSLAVVTSVAWAASATTYTVDPAEGDVSSLDRIILTFDGSVEELSYNTVVSDGISNYRCMTAAVGDTYVVTLSESLADGRYNVTIPASTISVAGEAFDQTIMLTYDLTQPEREVTVSVNPEPGKIAWLGNVTVTLEGARQASYEPVSTETTAKLAHDGEYIRIFSDAMVAGNRVTFAVRPTITSGGEYTLSIPDATILADGKPVGPLSFTYILPDFDCTVTPAPGELEDLGTVCFAFAPSAKVAEVQYSTVTVIRDGEPVRYITSARDNKFNITLIDPAIAGEYVVTVPAGTLTVDGALCDRELTATYQISGVAPGYSLEIEPADGSTIYDMQHFVLTFDGIERVTATVNSTDSAPYLTDAQGYREATVSAVSVEGNALELSLAEPITKPGVYTLNVPSAAYLLEGARADDITATYTLVEKRYVVNPSEETVLYNLNTVEILFYGVSDVAVTTPDATVPVVNAEADEVSVMQLQGSRGILELIPDTELATPGRYMLFVPGNLYKLDGVPGYDIVLRYTLFGTADVGVTVADMELEIYDLNGVRMKYKPCTGLYIINGRKVYIR